MLAQDTRNASANADLFSSRIKSAGDIPLQRTARGIALTVSPPTCCCTCALLWNFLSRSSSRTESKLPRVNPAKAPAKASDLAFGEVDVAEGLAREAMMELGVMNAGSAAVSAILFSKLTSNDLMDSAFPW